MRSYLKNKQKQQQKQNPKLNQNKPQPPKLMNQRTNQPTNQPTRQPTITKQQQKATTITSMISQNQYGSLANSQELLNPSRELSKWEPQ